MEQQRAMSDSDDESSSSEILETRPNRWTGPASTWQSITEQERGLTASLTQIRNNDLSIHLYNSHGLKRRARRFHSRKRRGEKFDEEGEGHGWVPPKNWTAWPLPPDVIPREEGPDHDRNEGYTFKKRELGWPSRELEDCLVGTAIKFAKEKFQEREWEAKNAGQVDGDDVDDEDGGVRLQAGTEDIQKVPPESSGRMEGESDEENTPDPIIKEPSEAPSPRTWLRPVVSADDERSHDILRPSIRHVLSKLDEVLMALHHARETCYLYTNRSGADTDDDSRAGSTIRQEASRSAVKRGRGRPRKFDNLTSRPKSGDSNQAQEPDDPALFGAKKAHRGRPKKEYPRLEGESEKEHLIRIARIQKKPLPKFSASPEPSPTTKAPSPLSEISRKSSVRRATLEELRTSRQKKLGLRDWSEVVGTAALVGFSPDVIARTAQRCADLFDEGMMMRNLVEAPFAEKDVDLETMYFPEELPDFDAEDEDEDSTVSDGDSDESEPHAMGSRSTSRGPNRRAPRKEAYYCPIEDCPRQDQGFAWISGLRRHFLNSHEMTKEEADECLANIQEMDGAVHIDGFLKPMREKRGIRGVDKGPRKRGRWTEKDARPDEGDGDASEEISSTDSDDADSHDEDESQSSNADAS